MIHKTKKDMPQPIRRLTRARAVAGNDDVDLSATHQPDNKYGRDNREGCYDNGRQHELVCDYEKDLHADEPGHSDGKAIEKFLAVH